MSRLTEAQEVAAAVLTDQDRATVLGALQRMAQLEKVAELARPVADLFAGDLHNHPTTLLRLALTELDNHPDTREPTTITEL